MDLSCCNGLELGHLVPVNGTLNDTNCKDILDNIASNIVAKIWGGTTYNSYAQVSTYLWTHDFFKSCEKFKRLELGISVHMISIV